MSEPDLPWSEPLPLERVGQGFRRHLSADEGARRRVAKALDLVDVPRLEADLEVRARPMGGVVRGRVVATVVQTCGITLEPFETEIATAFEADYTTEPPAEPSPGEELGLADLDQPDVVENGILDLGHYIVEHLALELDPFPRKPGVAFAAPEPDPEPNAFAQLAQLRPKADKD